MDEVHRRWLHLPILWRLISALSSVFLSHTAFLCYCAITVLHAQAACLLTLPLPLIVFFWAALSPRPSHTLWMIVIFYVQVSRSNHTVQWSEEVDNILAHYSVLCVFHDEVFRVCSKRDERNVPRNAGIRVKRNVQSKTEKECSKEDINGISKHNWETHLGNIVQKLHFDGFI